MDPFKLKSVMHTYSIIISSIIQAVRPFFFKGEGGRVSEGEVIRYSVIEGEGG